MDTGANCFWKTFNNLKNKVTIDQGSSYIKNELGNTTTTKKEFEFTLERYYSSLCKTDLSNPMMDNDFAVDTNKLIENLKRYKGTSKDGVDVSLKDLEVLEAPRECNTNSCPGDDGISFRELKAVSVLLNVMWNSEHLGARWLIAIKKPFLKKGIRQT